MLPKKINIQEVKDFVASCGPGTKMYCGCDSEKLKIGKDWYADFVSVVVVHKEGKHGCRCFGALERERDYDANKKKPSMRLMTEVYKVAELYNQLKKEFPDVDIEVHLDINPDEAYGSSIVVDQAKGYIQGVCGVTPKIKDEAFAASYCADRYKEIYQLPYYVNIKEKEVV